MKHKLLLLSAVVSLLFVGCEKEVTPCDGCFRISKTQQVKFAPGNLQCNYTLTSEGKQFVYSFGRPTEYLGVAPAGPNTTFDLFAWGTGDNPYHFSDTLTVYPEFHDWGNNTILDTLGNPTSGWRSLTYEEWNYVINDRPNAARLRCAATVDGTRGMLLLPDSWSYGDVPHKFSPDYSDTVFFTTGYGSNDDWQKFLNAGAVFLPAAGAIRNTHTQGVNQFGRYWTSSEGLLSTQAFFFGFMGNNDFTKGFRNLGFAVRLAKDQ